MSTPNTAITTSTWEAELLRIYDSSKLFEPMERTSTVVWDMFQEADDIEPRGAGLYFRAILHSAHRVGTPSDSGDIPNGGVRQEVQCNVSGVQVASSFKISEKALNAAQGDGSFGGDAVHEAVVEATQNLFTHIDSLLTISDGNGVLATVDGTVSTSLTVVGALPLHVFNVYPGMYIDIVDTSGAVQAGPVQVTDVDEATRTLTLDTAVSATAGWYICISGYYGNAPFGLYGIVDDGDVMGTFFGQSRSTYPKLNAITDDKASNALVDYDERDLRALVHKIERQGGSGMPDVIMGNDGMISAVLDQTIKDRQYNVTGKSVPAYGTGYDIGNLFFQYKNNQIPFKAVNSMPVRQFWVLTKKTFRKHTLRKPGWWGGQNGKVLLPTPSSSGGTYQLSFTAAMVADLNISCRRAIANGRLSGRKDRELGGDS